ncbi:hypothetical protein [Nonomuraea gerenzanensis]|uniref:Basic proline-rich protein n=1 Tax=Nonomuraea gerenzanensis TaxID=93944 RepID=A0A1M4EF16_9ACTN|nr:hypothetical protein [Nonomuraea gerenzanensis]UBU09119.1 hypothetical protein LCN96_32630 [Nonomuraea gerenzanensis]SBO97505.1 Basic proline-rich protein [Nonomuraea gerenzanensis]
MSSPPERPARPEPPERPDRPELPEPPEPFVRPESPERRPPRVLDQVPSVIGLVCGAVAVLYLPVLFGLAGVVLGVVGHARGEPLGRWAAIAAGAGMLLGTLLSILLTPR